MIDFFYAFMIAIGKRMIQKLAERKGIGQLTDIQKGNELRDGELKTIDIAAIEVFEKADLDESY